MFVIVTGNIAAGFVVLGPFPNEHDADEYLESMEDIGNGEAVVMEVQPLE